MQAKPIHQTPILYHDSMESQIFSIRFQGSVTARALLEHSRPILCLHLHKRHLAEARMNSFGCYCRLRSHRQCALKCCSTTIAEAKATCQARPILSSLLHSTNSVMPTTRWKTCLITDSKQELLALQSILTCTRGGASIHV